MVLQILSCLLNCKFWTKSFHLQHINDLNKVYWMIVHDLILIQFDLLIINWNQNNLFSIFDRCEVERGPEGVDAGRAVHRRDACPNQKRVRDRADASRRVKPGPVRRVAVGRSRNRVDGGWARSRVWLQSRRDLQVNNLFHNFIAKHRFT